MIDFISKCYGKCVLYFKFDKYIFLIFCCIRIEFRFFGIFGVLCRMWNLGRVSFWFFVYLFFSSFLVSFCIVKDFVRFFVCLWTCQFVCFCFIFSGFVVDFQVWGIYVGGEVWFFKEERREGMYLCFGNGIGAIWVGNYGILGIQSGVQKEQGVGFRWVCFFGFMYFVWGGMRLEEVQRGFLSQGFRVRFFCLILKVVLFMLIIL